MKKLSNRGLSLFNIKINILRHLLLFQIQRVAQSSGPLYLQRIQAAQQQGQAQEAIDAAQRKLTSATLRRQPLPVPVPSIPQTQQYYSTSPAQPQGQIKYARPQTITIPVQYRQIQQQQPQRPEKENPEDYDVSFIGRHYIKSNRRYEQP